MSARRAPRYRYASAVLTVTASRLADGPDGPELRLAPRAVYECRVCPFTATAEGPQAVAEFTATIRGDHRAQCPALAGAGPGQADAPRPGATTPTAGRRTRR